MIERIATVQIARLPIGDIFPHPRNPRKHPKPGSTEWEILRRSLDRDYFDPVVVNERNGKLVSGHLRIAVLREMGFTHVDVSVVHYDKATTYRAVSAILSGFTRLITIRNHCKVICLPTDSGHHFVIEGSANLRSSDNLEQIVITNDPATLAFHRQWMADLAHA